MRLLVKEKHDGEGEFPIFTKGTIVSNLSTCEESQHWLSCIINGYETYIPETYVADGILTQDYNPSEIIVERDQIITLIGIVFEWLYVKDENNNTGWIPASKVISI